MWFRNLQIFRLADAWQYASEDLATALNRGLFVGCGATDPDGAGPGAVARRGG